MNQVSQVNFLVDKITAANVNVLPALVNPEALLSQPNPHYSSPGTPSEAYGVVRDSYRILERIPGMVEMLAKRVGKGYNSNLSLLISKLFCL